MVKRLFKPSANQNKRLQADVPEQFLAGEQDPQELTAAGLTRKLVEQHGITLPSVLDFLLLIGAD